MNCITQENIILAIKSRKMKWAGHVTRRGEEKIPTYFLWGNPKDILSRRPRRRLNKNIKMDLQGIGWKVAGLICVAYVAGSC